jgi:hypothetical protein
MKVIRCISGHVELLLNNLRPDILEHDNQGIADFFRE